MSHQNGPGETSQELDDFVLRYFHDWRVLESGTRAERVAAARSDESRPADWLSAALHMRSDGPEEAWPVILALVERAPNHAALGFVAAGELEDLVRLHGERFGERLVERARSDNRFREALRGVWGWDDVSEPLRRRLFELIGPTA